ncbi:hypothetical protein ABQD61_06840 [Enterococcus asini]|uniref:hypothetical protein n=1 Tax=Enterococcus asini TaxID=57732 RepID=UPI0032E3FAE7
MDGWITLHRKLLDKPIWHESTPEQKVILITLMLMANHKEKQWEWQGRPYKAKPGQFVTSINSIVERCGKGVSAQNVRTALKRFEKYEFLTNQSTKQNRLITIVNWGFYQDMEQPTNKATNSQLTDDQQTANRQLTTNNNVNNATKKQDNKTSSLKRKARVYDPSSIYYILAERLFKQICQNQEIKTPDLNRWADDIRKMIEIDKRTEDQVRGMIDWATANDFWSANILSARKLREKYDVLKGQANREYKATKSNQNSYGKPYKTESVTNWDEIAPPVEANPALEAELDRQLAEFYQEGDSQ